MKNNVFCVSPSKTMQNHLEISSKNKFRTQSKQNLTKTLTLDMSGLAKTRPGGQVLIANQRKHFFKNYSLPFLLANVSFSDQKTQEHVCLLCWQRLVLLDWPWQARTCPKSEFWFNFACFGFKADFLTKFLNDSAWFCLEKLKKTCFFNQKPQNLINNPKEI